MKLVLNLENQIDGILESPENFEEFISDKADDPMIAEEAIEYALDPCVTPAAELLQALPVQGEENICGPLSIDVQVEDYTLNEDGILSIPHANYRDRGVDLAEETAWVEESGSEDDVNDVIGEAEFDAYGERFPWPLSNEDREKMMAVLCKSLEKRREQELKELAEEERRFNGGPGQGS